MYFAGAISPAPKTPSRGRRRRDLAFGTRSSTEEILSERLSSVVELARINAEFAQREIDIAPYVKPKPRSWEFSRYSHNRSKRKGTDKLPSPKKTKKAKVSKSSPIPEDKSVVLGVALSESGLSQHDRSKKAAVSAPLPLKKTGPHKKRKTPEPLPADKRKGKAKKPAAGYHSCKFSKPFPDHIDPGLPKFRFETQQYKDYYFEEGDLVYSPFGDDKKCECGFNTVACLQSRLTRFVLFPSLIQTFGDILTRSTSFLAIRNIITISILTTETMRKNCRHWTYTRWKNGTASTS